MMTALYSVALEIGQVLGLPLTVGLVLIIVNLRDHGRRIEKLEGDREESEKYLDSKLDSIYTKLNDMAKDVAVLKDRAEREGQK